MDARKCKPLEAYCEQTYTITKKSSVVYHKKLSIFTSLQTVMKAYYNTTSPYIYLKLCFTCI